MKGLSSHIAGDGSAGLEAMPIENLKTRRPGPVGAGSGQDATNVVKKTIKNHQIHSCDL